MSIVADGRRHVSPLTWMAEAHGWVMVRHPRAVPFAISRKEWDALTDWTDEHEAIAAAQDKEIREMWKAARRG